MVVFFPAVPQQNQMQNASTAVQQQVFVLFYDQADLIEQIIKCGFFIPSLSSEKVTLSADYLQQLLLQQQVGNISLYLQIYSKCHSSAGLFSICLNFSSM